MRAVRVGGVWLHTIGPYADLTTSHIWPRGCEEASWRMDPSLYHPLLDRGGPLVEVFDSGIRHWRGFLAESSTVGEFHANGSWSEATGVYALDASGNATNTVDTAVDQAIARGAVSWTRPASLRSTAWGTPDEPMLLTDLLDKALASQSKRWWVDPDGALRAAADPTTPTYYVPQAMAGRRMTLADDTYYSHLVGQYVATGPVFKTVTVGDAAAAAWFTYKEAKVDLLGMGVITAGTATTELTNRLALVGPRMGFADNLDLGYGEITTPGGTPVALAMPRACTRTGGVMIRLLGVRDRSKPGGIYSVTDIVPSRSVYTDGAATVQLTPMGKAPRELEELLAGTPTWEVA